MDITVQSSGLDNIVGDCIREVENAMRQVGEEFVEDAKADGNYHDVTGNLRRSNTYSIEDGVLVVGNSADYATKVEAKGKEVCSTAALRAVNKLKDMFG